MTTERLKSDSPIRNQKKHDAFEEFYRREFPLVVRFIFRLGANMAEAEDATQGAMEALLGRFEHVQKNPAPYVRVSAKNLWRRARSTSPSVHPSGVGAELGAMLA